MMKLYRKLIPKIAKEMIETLRAENDVEIPEEKASEAELDLASVIVAYCNEEEDLNREARDSISRRGLSTDRFSMVKKGLASAKGHPVGEEGQEYIINQLLETLMHSPNIDEVYSEDHVMRKKLNMALKKYGDIDEVIDREAVAKLKHLSEGSPEWEIEYGKVVTQIKRTRGLI